jgi:hypothetical protein
MKKILLILEHGLIIRLNKAFNLSPFDSRMAFMRFLLEDGIEQMENDPYKTHERLSRYIVNKAAAKSEGVDQ